MVLRGFLIKPRTVTGKAKKRLTEKNTVSPITGKIKKVKQPLGQISMYTPFYPKLLWHSNFREKN